jgi:hypothetical protein
MAKKAWKLYVEEELITDFEGAARDYGRRTPNEVAAEVLQTYLPFWKQTEEAKQAVIAKQQQRAGLEVSQPYAKGRGSKGEAARVRRDAESREEKKRK